MSKASQDKLGTLHNKVAEKLIAMVENPDATAADISQAIKFLKDNNIMADVDLNEALQTLKETVEVRKLPFPNTRSN